jgi:hypothetical protein
MDSHSGQDSVHDEVILTTAAIVPHLRKQAATNKEKMSAYFAIAAAAFGFINDGCKSRRADYPTPR